MHCMSLCATPTAIIGAPVNKNVQEVIGQVEVQAEPEEEKNLDNAGNNERKNN